MVLVPKTKDQRLAVSREETSHISKWRPLARALAAVLATMLLAAISALQTSPATKRASGAAGRSDSAQNKNEDGSGQDPLLVPKAQIVSSNGVPRYVLENSDLHQEAAAATQAVSTQLALQSDFEDLAVTQLRCNDSDGLLALVKNTSDGTITFDAKAFFRGGDGAQHHSVGLKQIQIEAKLETVLEFLYLKDIVSQDLVGTDFSCALELYSLGS